MIEHCLLPVAGYGTRFLPATKAMPKEMLPVVDKPLVQYAVEEACLAGIHRFCFVTGRGKRAIEDHFDSSYELESQIKGTKKEKLLESIDQLQNNNEFTYVRQREMKGLGHAVLKGRSLVGHNPFAVSLSDDLCVYDDNDTPVFNQMVNVYEQTGKCVVAVQEIDPGHADRYGIIAPGDSTKDYVTVNSMIEKPQPHEAPSNLAVIGRYILTPDIFDILEKLPPGANGEVQLTDALKIKAEQGKVVAVVLQGRRFDCGSIEGFVEATNHVFARRNR